MFPEWGRISQSSFFFLVLCRPSSSYNANLRQRMQQMSVYIETVVSMYVARYRAPANDIVWREYRVKGDAEEECKHVIHSTLQRERKFPSECQESLIRPIFARRTLRKVGCFLGHLLTHTTTSTQNVWVWIIKSMKCGGGDRKYLKYGFLRKSV